MRGKTHIDAACVSLLGSTQPGRLAEYVRRAIHGGAGDDGLIQRFSLLVWPDACSEWANVDRYPDSAARQSAWKTFERFDKLTADESGAEREQFEATPFLRFDDEAQELFTEWRAKHEVRLRSGEMHPALESHLAKYRKLVPTLALINCLADGGTRAIDADAVLRALAFADYLETHARRVYAAGNQAETTAAKAILHRIRRGDLSDGFTARDIHQRDWSGLTDGDQVQAGLTILVEYCWIAAANLNTGGRRKVIYHINPKAR
jgi:putative DNA primase/helicase